MRGEALPAFLLLLALALQVSCSPKTVKVAVSPESLLKAAEATREGDAAFERKEYYAALLKYLAAFRLNPQSEHLNNRLGLTYAQLNLYGEASEAFRRAIVINKKYPYAYNNLGSIYFAQKNYRKAEKYFKKAIQINANEASFHLNLGSVYFEKKKREAAIAAWRRSYELDPNIFSKPTSVSLSSSGSSLMERYLFLARLTAAAGNVEATIENLKQAFNKGFTDIDEIRKSRDFEPVRDDPVFGKFLEEAAQWLKLQPTDDVRPPLR